MWPSSLQSDARFLRCSPENNRKSHSAFDEWDLEGAESSREMSNKLLAWGSGYMVDQNVYNHL